MHDELLNLKPVVTDDPLLRDVVAAERDIFALASAHGLSLEALAKWFDQPGKAAAVQALCRLADLQCQAMLSRYRLIAASRLIAQVGNEDGALGPEQVRKACVDLLKAKLTELDAEGKTREVEEEDPALAFLKQAIQGEEG